MTARRVAALYDVHGNLPALEAVLADVERAGVHLVVSGGDLAFGPMPAEALARLAALGGRVRFVRGNGDRAVLESVDPDEAPSDVWLERQRWVSASLAKEHRRLLARFEETVTVDVDGLGRTLFCHGSPRSDEEILTRVTSDERLAEILRGVEADVVVCGHTHVQFDRRLGGIRVVNAGSVGMPYEGEPGGYWALLGPDVELRRTEYDADVAAAAIRATGFPGAEAFVDEFVRSSYPADEASAHFERLATG